MLMDSSAVAARPDDEEARRSRSTDCIYFLSSPLTCNKAKECEHRHSDAARMNPRECWYWFNGNCTNPKCSFRHPPLDNLLGAPAIPLAAQQSAPQVPVPPQSHGTSSIPSSGTGTTKQGVPCYYFQKGVCAKGDRCAFVHVPQAAESSALQPMQKVFAYALQPNTHLKNSWTKPNSSAQQNTASSIFDKSKVSTYHGEPAQKQNLARRIDQSSRIYQKQSNSDVQSDSAKHYQPQPSVKDDIAENSMEVGGFVREPSAGSGVLVGSINYKQSFKRNHNSYQRAASAEQHTGMRQIRGSHDSEGPYRSSGETLLSDKRISQREPMNVTAGSSDLRHRLLKQRRLSNSRLTQVPGKHDAYLDDRHHRRGNEHAAHDGQTRSRMQSRIELPGETTFARPGSRSERVEDREPRARLSPPKHTDLRGKLHGRLKARLNEDIPDKANSLVRKTSIGEDGGSLHFAGPKSLAELKAKKVHGNLGEDAFCSSTAPSVMLAHRSSETVGSRDSWESVIFEGPKPLSDILKRKRETTSADSGSTREEEAAGAEGESQNELQILESDIVEVNMEVNEEEEDAFHCEDDMAYRNNLSPADENAVNNAGRELDDNFSQDLDAPQDYEYDVADINADEDNDYQEYEDDDDLEDDDDFARKVGVMIS